ncbi:hypothetical protein CAL7716_085600 [Calothrix sp. PCC 7716]|nr:hypothetical protein CAL7716_085600 [Calothrix sp. PCC 7716]
MQGLRDKEEYDVEMHPPLIREDGALVLSFTGDEATITITLSEQDARRIIEFYERCTNSSSKMNNLRSEASQQSALARQTMRGIVDKP